jgi:Recombinase
MTKHRQRRLIAKTRVHMAPPTVEPARPAQRVVARQASVVERLAYTRSQAAEALGISRSTFIRRVLPYVETIEMPWGVKLIPVDELHRLVAERRQPAKSRRTPVVRGRPPLLSPEVIERICSERIAGRSLRAIAADLNADGTSTAHGGDTWWPSTIRSVLARSTPGTSAKTGPDEPRSRELAD